MKTTIATLAAAAFLTCILAANYVTSAHGIVPVWPDIMPGPALAATAGTYFAGLAFVLRDTVHDLTSRATVLALIVAGAALSLAVTPLFTDGTYLPPGVTVVSISVASGIAFALSELADMLIYQPLRQKGYIRAAAASNIVGTIVDTVLFLWISGFGFTSHVVAGQFVGKLAITAAVIGVVFTVRQARAARTVTA